MQITAEQLIREAKERELEVIAPPPKSKIFDQADLADFQLRKRKEFEDNIRKIRSNVSYWIKYADWEELQGEIDRARSVWERALDVDPQNMTFWIKYVEMEIKAKQINHARNIFDRAVTLMPRANQMWYKYVHMEEMLNQFGLCRQVFERWMQWNPEEQAWQSYINFETRCGELENARQIYAKFVVAHASSQNWIRYAKFELRNGNVAEARGVYERAVEYFGKEYTDAELILAFAQFEEKVKEIERARVILQYGKENLADENQRQKIANEYAVFQKKHGTKQEIKNAILDKRWAAYKAELGANPLNFETWFDYLLLTEANYGHEDTTELYEQAIANVPPGRSKESWSRYIYLWIYYAVFTEHDCKNAPRASQIYEKCLDVLNSRKICFSKLWIHYAKCLIRNGQLDKARKKLGYSIGLWPKPKTFREYIAIESELLEFDRCRKLYEKWLEVTPGMAIVWIKYYELEKLFGETDRARAILKAAVDFPGLNTPELVWKTWIDYETELGNLPSVRHIYEMLLERTNHPKVWISYSNFERKHGSVISTRKIFNKACQKFQQIASDALKDPSLAPEDFDSTEHSEERAQIFDEWLKWEQEVGDAAQIDRLQARMPNRVKKRRQLFSSDGAESGWEEYYEFIFPDDEAAKPNIKLLSMAKKWKSGS